MALCPFATRNLITSDSVGRGHTPVRLTLHTAVSSAVDLYKDRPALHPQRDRRVHRPRLLRTTLRRTYGTATLWGRGSRRDAPLR